ncbi:MAG: hypothetical protein K6A64_03485, partial [Bacteroidales bacterium]|nr:hypothetical protein [Bacteroidales bacterium]
MKKYLFIAILATLSASPLFSQQVYNMSFDTWSKSSGAWNLYAKDAKSSQKIWDTANKGLSLLGINGTTP